MNTATHLSSPEELPVKAPEAPNPLIADVNPRFLNDILPFSRTLRYAAGEEVIVKGAEAHYLYYVEKGTVEVSHTTESTRIIVALIGAGEFFGEIGFFDGTTRVRDIQATEDTVIRVFDTASSKQMQEENPHLYGSFLTLLAQSICTKFRRILEEREPLTAYAASLSTGKRGFQETKPVPPHLSQTKKWHYVNRLVEEFKSSFFDLSYQLQQDTGTLVPERLRNICYDVMDIFNDRLQEAATLLENDEHADILWGYAFKEIFPYFMRSRFAERAYYKPRGYAGDFLMMEMIYANEPDGDGKLGRLMDAWCLDSVAARAVRGRRVFLKEQLDRLCGEKAKRGNPVRVMNLACGSNRELFDFIATCGYSELIAALSIDADAYALEYTNKHVNVFPHSASVRFMSDNVVRWALGRVRHNFGTQDVIYSAGLTDYLDDRLFTALANRCYDQLETGGTLIIGNFGFEDKNKAFLDHILQWKLIHRTEEQLKRIFANSRFGNNVEIMAEENGVNLFAVAVKTV